MKRALTTLGRPPCLMGFLLWGSAVFFAIAAWHIYLLFPLWGLIAIGLTPFVSLFLFFRGAGCMSRTLPYLQTAIKAHKLELTPTWGTAGGGFLLIDEEHGFWVANGKHGALSDLTSLEYHTDGEAFLLEGYKTGEAPVFSVGMRDAGELKETAERLHRLVCSFKNKQIPLTEKRLPKEN